MRDFYCCEFAFQFSNFSVNLQELFLEKTQSFDSVTKMLFLCCCEGLGPDPEEEAKAEEAQKKQEAEAEAQNKNRKKRKLKLRPKNN